MLFPQSNGVRQRHELDGFWDFQVDPADCGEKQGWFKGFDGVKIAVPAAFNEQLQYEAFEGVDLFYYEGAVWYGKRFFVPSGMASRGEKIRLRFGAVYNSAKVWLNGKLLGEHRGGYLPFEFDVSQSLLADGENLLVVRADNRLTMSDLPVGMPRDDKYSAWRGFVDWFLYGGIYRPVVLYSVGQESIEDIAVKTDIDGGDGVIRYEITLSGKSAGEATVTVSGGGFSTKQKHDRPGKKISGELRIKKAAFWTPENPTLYKFHVELSDKNAAVDRYELRIGIRTIKVEGDRLLLNGKPIFLRGVCRHEDFPAIGNAMSQAVINKDVSLLKWLGANTVRTAHYPHAEEFLNFADEAGLLVFGEVPAWCLFGDVLNDELLANHKQMIADLVARDKNHSSVIGWFVANEPYYTDGKSIDVVPPPKVMDYFRQICEFTKSIDDRPITVAGCTNTDEHILQFCDIASVNRYFGWYHYPGRLEYAAEKLSENLDNLYKKVKKPIIISEFGADGVIGVHHDPPVMFSEEYQADFYRTMITLFESKPYIAGEMVWVFCDFRTTQSPTRVVYNRKGIFGRDRMPKMGTRVIRELWEKELPGR